ncbi:Type 1 glutamine amidotransferase-like domain-containing protein [Candidatus Woesearchaeota archaeon]|nr:Type 1 glutamine amidotransferase-like domain-containing protein [Candidatus Woesearchaeota archaeon]
MVNKKYLLSGHTSTGGLKEIDRRIIAEADQYSDDRNILILNLTSSDMSKLRGKREFFQEYFKKLGATNIDCFSDESPINLQEAFERASILYLPGGDTETFIRKIRENCLESRIAFFDGITSGNSAGAYVLCTEYLKIRDDEVKIIPAMDLVNFWIKAHYEPKFDPVLIELSKGRDIFALENVSAIGVDFTSVQELDFTGNIWKFCEGRKEKVN